jgi:hypothetical protein
MSDNTTAGNRHTPVNAPELVRAFVNKCGTVRGPVKSQLLEKCFRPKATGINSFFKAELRQSQFSKAELPKGNRQQATGNRQQATGNRQQATGNRQQATGNILYSRYKYPCQLTNSEVNSLYLNIYSHQEKRRIAPYGTTPAF